jgi:hypothetical protein
VLEKRKNTKNNAKECLQKSGRKTKEKHKLKKKKKEEEENNFKAQKKTKKRKTMMTKEN